MLSEQIACIRQRIVAACRRCGRDPSTVTLIGVTKGVPVETIRQALALGLTDLGENRVQEARAKQAALGSRLQAQGSGLEPTALSLQPVRWHMIGHLQRNKAKDAVAMFDVIHSVDTCDLADTLEQQAARVARGSRLKAFIQVNVSGETTKFGCRPDQVMTLGRHMSGFPHLQLAGLMTIAPFADHPEHARPWFRALRALRDALASAFSLEPSALSLSMGMSQDFEVAIEEGADHVRVGTAIFGPSIQEGQGTGDG